MIMLFVKSLFHYTISVNTYRITRYSMLGKVDDPATELANGDVYMTNSTGDSTR